MIGSSFFRQWNRREADVRTIILIRRRGFWLDEQRRWGFTGRSLDCRPNLLMISNASCRGDVSICVDIGGMTRVTPVSQFFTRGDVVCRHRPSAELIDHLKRIDCRHVAIGIDVIPHLSFARRTRVGDRRRASRWWARRWWARCWWARLLMGSLLVGS